MKVSILTSDFPNGFPTAFGTILNKYIQEGSKLAFVASEFERIYEKTDRYCDYFVKMFEQCGIHFEQVSVIDSRMSKEVAQQTIKKADVIWLSGGDTPTQFSYLKAYDLLSLIREHQGVIIGMSAGSINMAKIAVCTKTCEHEKQEIYEGIGVVNISVEPHLDKENISEELLQLSREYTLYGMCDDSVILCENETVTYLGDIFLIEKGEVKQISKNG